MIFACDIFAADAWLRMSEYGKYHDGRAFEVGGGCAAANLGKPPHVRPWDSRTRSAVVYMNSCNHGVT